MIAGLLTQWNGKHVQGTVQLVHTQRAVVGKQARLSVQLPYPFLCATKNQLSTQAHIFKSQEMDKQTTPMLPDTSHAASDCSALSGPRLPSMLTITAKMEAATAKPWLYLEGISTKFQYLHHTYN